VQEVQDTWEMITTLGQTDELGLRIMKNMFTIQPRLLRLFSFREEKQLYRSEALKRHYRALIDMIDKAVKGLRDIK